MRTALVATLALGLVTLGTSAATAGLAYSAAFGEAPFFTTFDGWTPFGEFTLPAAGTLRATVTQHVVGFGAGAGIEIRLVGPGVDAWLLGHPAGTGFTGGACPAVECTSVVRDTTVEAQAGVFTLLADGATNRDYWVTVTG